MTSIEVPYSIAAALPTLSVMDVTNDVAQTLVRSGRSDGIAYIHATHGRSLIRIQGGDGVLRGCRGLLELIVPREVDGRERLVAALVAPRSEQVPFKEGALCLGRFQRILLFSLDAEHRNEWTLTLLG